MAQEEQVKVGGVHETLQKAEKRLIGFKIQDHPIFLILVIGLSWYFGGPMATIILLLLVILFK